MSTATHEPAVGLGPAHSPPVTSRGTWIPELDGLRAVACLAVVLVHYNPAPLQPSDALLGVLNRGFARLSLANVGVIFFYTLSAFLLTYLAVKESAQSGGFQVRRFWVRRCLRIWPLYFLCLAVSFLQLRSGSIAPMQTWSWTRDHSWMFILFLSNWSLALNQVGGYSDHSIPELAILWSIAVEEQFYLVYPLLFIVATGSRRGRIVIAGFVVLAALVFRMAFLFLPVGPLVPSSSGGMYYATWTYLDVFLAGAIAGWVAAGASHLSVQAKTMFTRRGVGTLLVGCLLLISFGWNDRWWYPYGWVSLVGYGVTGVAFSSVLLWVWSNPDARLCRVLRSGPMRTLGVLSYGMYLWHPVAGFLATRRLSVLGPSVGQHDLLTLAHWSMYLVTTLGIAALTYGLVERPFLSLKGKLRRGAPQGRQLQLVEKLWIPVVVVAGVIVVAIDFGVQYWFGVPPSGE